jgi:glycosyltransferase involved in cell wall biosynthesis
MISTVTDDPLSATTGRTPRVSILVPAWNAAATVVEAVTSALAQTVPDIEVIVSDDGSAAPVSEALADVHDDRLRIIRSGQNRGVSVARNAALAVARAPVVAQLDADDYWLPDHLEHLLPALSAPTTGLAYSNVEVVEHPGGLDRWIAERVPDDGFPVWVSDRTIHPVNDLAKLFRANPIPSPAVIMRTDAVRAVGGYPPWLTVGEDYLLYIRLRRAGWRFAYVDRRSAVYRWPNASRGASFDRRRHARQGVKLFAALAVQMPREHSVRARLRSELKQLVGTHVPGSVVAWQHLRETRERFGAGR